MKTQGKLLGGRREALVVVLIYCAGWLMGYLWAVR